VKGKKERGSRGEISGTKIKDSKISLERKSKKTGEKKTSGFISNNGKKRLSKTKGRGGSRGKRGAPSLGGDKGDLVIQI